MTGRVAGTGTWNDYRQARIGRVKLEKGELRASFQAACKPNNCLIDLRGIRLVPIE